MGGVDGFGYPREVIGIGEQRYISGPESGEAGRVLAQADLPSLEDLRFQAPGRIRVKSVLDEVLYGLNEADGARKDPRSQDVRRDIVEYSLRIVASAAIREPAVLAGSPHVHEIDDHDNAWPQRFTEMLGLVRPVDNGAKATADIVAQCAKVPVGLDKLVAIMSETVTDKLAADGRPRDQIFRAHMSNAAQYADIAWCASHGDLVGCPSWNAQKQDKNERAILNELKRHVAPEPSRDSVEGKGANSATENGDAARSPVGATGGAAAAPRPRTGAKRGHSGSAHGVVLPEAMVDLMSRLLDDGRWPSMAQREIAVRTRQTLRDYSDCAGLDPSGHEARQDTRSQRHGYCRDSGWAGGIHAAQHTH